VPQSPFATLFCADYELMAKQNNTDEPTKLAGKPVESSKVVIIQAQAKPDSAKGGGHAKKQNPKRTINDFALPQGPCCQQGHQYNQEF